MKRVVLLMVILLMMAGCTGKGESPRQMDPPPSPAMPVGFTPYSIAFWDGERGLVGGTAGSEGVLALTGDGGRTWTVVRRVGARIYDLAAAPGSQTGWAKVSYCANPGEEGCTATLLRTEDGGRTWADLKVEVSVPSFADPQNGWALAGRDPRWSEPGRLLRTADGGKSWQPIPAPCSDRTGGLRSVSTLDGTKGWALCVNQPGTGQQPKALFVTQNAGQSWTPVGALGAGSGYPAGIFFQPSGRGWIWHTRGALWLTENAGETWEYQPITQPESVEARSLSFLTDKQGFMLLQDNVKRRYRIVSTMDGGKSWVEAAFWPID